MPKRKQYSLNNNKLTPLDKILPLVEKPHLLAEKLATPEFTNILFEIPPSPYLFKALLNAGASLKPIVNGENILHTLLSKFEALKAINPRDDERQNHYIRLDDLLKIMSLLLDHKCQIDMIDPHKSIYLQPSSFFRRIWRTLLKEDNPDLICNLNILKIKTILKSENFKESEAFLCPFDSIFLEFKKDGNIASFIDSININLSSLQYIEFDLLIDFLDCNCDFQALKIDAFNKFLDSLIKLINSVRKNEKLSKVVEKLIKKAIVGGADFSIVKGINKGSYLDIKISFYTKEHYQNLTDLILPQIPEMPVDLLPLIYSFQIKEVPLESCLENDSKKPKLKK